MDRRCNTGRACRGAGPVVLSLVIAGSCIASAQADDKKRPHQARESMSISSRMHDEDQSDQTIASDTAAPTALNFIGLPLTFGARDAAIDRGPGVEAGFYASYDTKLADKMTFKARAGLAENQISERWLGHRCNESAAGTSAIWRRRSGAQPGTQLARHHRRNGNHRARLRRRVAARERAGQWPHLGQQPALRPARCDWPSAMIGRPCCPHRPLLPMLRQA